MPLTRDRFDALGDEEEGTTAERITEFLYENREHAFTRGEIAESIDRDPNTVGTNLSRLKERDLVHHKSQYWTITDDLKQLSDALRFSDVLSGIEEQFGPVIRDEDEEQAWADAQPDESHPGATEETNSWEGDPPG